jgi:hypothetical protein
VGCAEKSVDGQRTPIRIACEYSADMMLRIFARVPLASNPITMVRQSAKRDRTPEVLTAESSKRCWQNSRGSIASWCLWPLPLAFESRNCWACAGWDCDFEDGEIHLTRGIVRQHETAMKTEASRKPVPMEMGLADVLKTWRMECGYSQPSDYIFASADMDGKQPLWPNSAIEDHIRPAAI